MANNPRLNVITNKVKHPSLRMNAVSKAISKGIPTIQYKIASGFAHRNDVDCFALLKKRARNNVLNRRRGSAGGSLRSPPPSASLTHSTNFVGGYSH
jgi:hypothetical protein